MSVIDAPDSCECFGLGRGGEHVVGMLRDLSRAGGVGGRCAMLCAALTLGA